MKTRLLFLGALLVISTACQKKESKQQVTVRQDSSYGRIIADTIIYDVSIRNLNPEDKWAEQCLKGLNHSLLVNNIFTMVYEGKAIAYNHETGEKLTSKQVEQLEQEEGFSRSGISMVQFKEAWYINQENEMTKKVLSMVLGMPQYTSSGEFKGNKAIFRVEMP